MEGSTTILDREPATPPSNPQGAIAFGIAVVIVIVYFAFFANRGPGPEHVKHEERMREMQRQTDLLWAESRRGAESVRPVLSSATYSKLRVGESGYGDACQILNGPGREVSRTGGYTTYVWNHEGKVITAIFNERDVLVSRSQSRVP